MPNRLASQTSPYLLQHASDPVDWYPWGEEAWAKAVAENKPVLLCIGYASCHWCQVMGREAFTDPEVAAALNKDFVAIIVDREERPDLDSLYIEALQTLTGEAGWPLTLFLTPDRKLFFGGTYFPPTARDGLPALIRVIESVQDEWAFNRRELQRQADGVLKQMRERASTLPEPQPVTNESLNVAIAAVQAIADQTFGGFGEAPKFPQPWLVELMLRAALRGPGGAHGIADLALRRMARGGIYDQLGGGFHRYSADAAWRVPHFEKMLYDNALLARVYTHAWQARRDPAFRRVATETIEYLLAELASPEGTFWCGQDSDVGGMEGGFYLWSAEEFLAVEGITQEDARFFGVHPEGISILTAAGDDVPDGPRQRLRAAREARADTRPAVDTKVLTSWNGLAIAALAEAGSAFDRPDLLAAATQAADAVLAGALEEDGTLRHALRSGPAGQGLGQAPAGGPELLEDYAYLADGLLALWEATFDARWLAEAERLTRRMLVVFGDPGANGNGALFATSLSQEVAVIRRKDLIDSTTPSPNGVASLVLQRLGALRGDASLSSAGAAILEAAQPTMAAVPQECGTLLAAQDLYLSGPREIAVVGDLASPAGQALLRQVWERFIPNRVLVAGQPGVHSPLLEGREAIGGQPTAYVCEHHVCKRPTSDPAELARQLRSGGHPTPEQVSRAADLARFTLHRISLFEGLDNPLWIGPLQERGFFDDPPSPIDHYVPGATGSAPWPASKYLARMAGVDPFAVHRVALGIPDTRNSLVHEDLADAALALPPDLASDIARRSLAWLQASQHHVMLPKKLGSLLSGLAKGGQGPVALDLARSLLDLLAEPVREVRAVAAEETFAVAPQPAARFGAWDYEQILTEHYADLVRAVQLPALDLVADLLDKALTLSLPDGVEAAGAGGSDGSYLWRPAIGDDPHNLDRTLRNPLVTAVRDAAEIIARENPGMLGSLVERLTARGWPVFRRIALHLLAAFPNDAPALVAACLADRSLLEDPHFAREFLLLARQQLAGLDDMRREEILYWVRQGPDLDRWDAVPDRWGMDPADQEESDAYRMEWSADRLAFLEGPLGGSDAAAFAFPVMDPPVDLSTPKQAEWLRTVPLEMLVRFCRTWRPPALIGAPLPGGLQKKLTEVTTSEPNRFADGAPELVDLPDEYLRAVVAGLREAVRQGTTFAWQPVLDLFVAVAGRRGDPARALRISIAQCLALGFNVGGTEIPHKHREQVWQILQPIAQEGDPVELPVLGASPVLRRSVAAEGLQAVARYALWVRRHIEQQPRSREGAQRGWHEMPEVLAVLAAHLAAGEAPQRSIEVQAFFGQWFPWLLMLDPEWAVAHREAIFPDEAELDHLRQAAWDTYLAKTPAFDGVFELLAGDYARMAGSLAGDEGLTRPQQGFAEHLMALYLRGRVRLAVGEGLLEEFFRRSHTYQRAHAMAWVGQTLQSQQERVPGEILVRLMRLWESRMAAARAAEDLSDYLEELSYFGSWFASGKFEEGWAVRQLTTLLALTGRVGNTPKVVERLKASMESMPYEVVQCIAALVASERGDIAILGWGKDAQQILSRIVGGPDPRARDMALDLLDTFDLQPITDLIRWS